MTYNTKWEIKYREDLKSFWVESRDRATNRNFIFSTHSLQRAWNRSSNVKTMQDFSKPVNRIMKCICNSVVGSWMFLNVTDEERCLIHDLDNSMMYIIQNNVRKGHIAVISTYNEFWGEYMNTRRTKEIWVSLTTGEWWD